MLLSLLKNLKQVGVSQIVSATLVVQGVAVQQSAVVDFSQQEALVSELNLQSKSQQREAKVEGNLQEKYWEDMTVLLEENLPTPAVSNEAVVEIANAFEAVAKDEVPTAPSPGPVGSPRSLVAISGSSSATSPLGGNSPQSNNSSPTRGPSSGNDVGAGNSVNSLNGALAEVEAKQDQDSNSPVATSSTQTNTESIQTPSANNPSEEIAEPTPTPEPSNEFEEYLSNVSLFRDGVLVGSLIEGAQVSVFESDNFEIQIGENEDFGSMRFTLTNSDSGQVVVSTIENLPLFQIFGGNGGSLATGNYQLSLEAYSQDGANGTIEAERTISFQLEVTPESPSLLANISLYRNGQFESSLNNGDVVYVNQGDTYTIVVEADNDFGSVDLDLEGSISGYNLSDVQNRIPFELSQGRNGIDFVSDTYTLDLKAFSSDGLSGNELDQREITFEVIVQ